MTIITPAGEEERRTIRRGGAEFTVVVGTLWKRHLTPEERQTVIAHLAAALAEDWRARHPETPVNVPQPSEPDRSPLTARRLPARRRA